MRTTSVDSALSGRNDSVSSVVSSASFAPIGDSANVASTQRAITTHLLRRPVTMEARTLTSGAPYKID